MVSKALARAASTSHLAIIGLFVALLVANAALGVGIATGQTRIAVLVAVMPLLGGVVLSLIVAQRELLVYAALLLATIGEGGLNKPLPGTGGSIFLTDLIVVLAVTGYAAARLTSPRPFREQLPGTVVLSWPFALFTVAILIGVVRGHDRYGLSYFSQPIRMFIYAGIAAALAGVSVSALYRAIVVIFYLDVIVQAPLALYHLATGTSQTASTDLSTGGTRPIALSTAMYLAGALVLALLNLELDRGRRRGLHLAIATLATFLIVLALGRTTFAALAVLLPLLFLGSRQLRWTAITWLPLVVPVIAAVFTIALVIRPSLGSTLVDRLTGHVNSDTALVQRQRKYDAALKGLGAQPVFGFGFGRPVHFTAVDGSVQSFSGDPENSYVWTLAGGGLFALGSMIVLILAFFADGIRRMRRTTGEARALVIFSMSLAFVFFFNTLTGPVLSVPRLMLTIWIAMLLPAVAMRTAAADEASEVAARRPLARRNEPRGVAE